MSHIDNPVIELLENVQVPISVVAKIPGRNASIYYDEEVQVASCPTISMPWVIRIWTS